MAAQVEIIRNFPRTELLKDGWSKSRLASAIQPAKFNADKNVYEESTLPDDLWREPNTGVIMLKPTVMKPEFWEDSPVNNAAMLPLSIWNYNNSSGGGTGLLALPHNNSIQTMRDGKASALIDWLVDAAIAAILSSMKSQLKWVMQTKDPLAPNEGWSVWCHPPGIYTDRATDYMLIAFGERYVLHLRMNGTASLWSNAGTTSTPNWVERTTFQYSGGGVDHNKPFQITVIPWGFGYITFMFSQSNEPNMPINTGVTSKAATSFLYDIAKHEGKDALSYDNSSKQWIKTKQGKLSVALRGVLWQYGFAFARVRYAASATLNVIPEQLPEINPYYDPTVTSRGFDGQLPPSGTGTKLTTSISDETNGAWDKNLDTQLVNKFTLQSSSDRMYTPELWSYDIEIPEKTHTPNWTPFDVAPKWSTLRFQRTTDPAVCSAEFRLENDQYDRLFTGWGPVQIRMSGVPVFDGYVYKKAPTVETRYGISPTSTGRAVITSHYSCRDMWLRLDEKLVPDYKFLDGLSLLDVIKALIRRAGFLESDIVVQDPNGYLASLSFEGFQDPNDQKGINQDGTVGDVLREILKSYSLLPIRVRYIGNKWYIYLAPQYNPSTPPALKFFLQSNPTLSDSARWAAGEYYVLTDLEYDVEEPAFNGLIARTAEGSGDGASGIQVVIPCGKTDQGVQDQNAFWFAGRAKLKIVAPPEITLAQSKTELSKIARVYYDRNSRRKAVVEFRGEWTPDIDVDQFIWLIGIDDDGLRTSYGAYRIETIDVEGKYDFRDESANPDFAQKGNKNPDMRFTFQASYTCVYVGRAVDANTPMFSEVLP